MAVNDIIAIKQNIGGSFDEIATNTVIDGLKVLKQNTSGGFDEAITPLTGDIIVLKQNSIGGYDESIIPITAVEPIVIYEAGIVTMKLSRTIKSPTAATGTAGVNTGYLYSQVSTNNVGASNHQVCGSFSPSVDLTSYSQAVITANFVVSGDGANGDVGFGKSISDRIFSASTYVIGDTIYDYTVDISSLTGVYYLKIQASAYGTDTASTRVYKVLLR